MDNCWWFFHQWDKWHQVEVTQIILGKECISLKQMRKCKKCGLEQLKRY